MNHKLSIPQILHSARNTGIISQEHLDYLNEIYSSLDPVLQRRIDCLKGDIADGTTVVKE